MLSKCSITELHPQPKSLFFFAISIKTVMCLQILGPQLVIHTMDDKDQLLGYVLYVASGDGEGTCI
jgi:hypothetical protein